MDLDPFEAVAEHFHKELVATFLTEPVDALVAEHRSRPLGPHGDALARLLNHLRSTEPIGKYIIVRPEPGRYEIGRITGDRRQGSIELVGHQTNNVDDAEHAVFLRRLVDAGLLNEGSKHEPQV